MYLLNEKLKIKILGWFGKQYNPDENTSPDALSNMEI
jgi:hypothetical protein